MSLLSSRGRFSDNNSDKKSIEKKDTSLLANKGRKPIDFTNKINNSSNAKNYNYNKPKNRTEKIKEFFNKDTAEFLMSKFSSNKDKRIKLNRINDSDVNRRKNINNTKNTNTNTSRNTNTKTKANDKFAKIRKVLTMILVELVTLVILFLIGSYVRVTKMTQQVSFDKAVVKNTNIDDNTLKIMKGFKTIAIFGVDSRTGSVGEGNNSDVNIIANLNLETGEAQLVSVYRDLYLSITDGNQYGKLNAAYGKGGPEAAVKAINKNLDLNIENFFSFNWKAVADGIELLGGIDLEITKSEFRYMNAFIHETCIATGIEAKNPAAHYIKSAGYQHLNGVQSVAYGRLRLMDSDFQRVERQKKVIELCLQKAKTLGLDELRLIMEVVLPQIAYEFDMNEIVSILKIITKINITESCGVPEVSNMVSMDMGNSGDCIVPLSLEKAVVKLHKILFNKDDYQPSNAVKRYSNRIIELRRKYENENLRKESIRLAEESAKLSSTESSEENNSSSNNENASNNENTNATTRKSSSQNSSSSNNSNDNNDTDDTNDTDNDNNNSSNNATEESYEEEPEEDDESEETRELNNGIIAVPARPGERIEDIINNNPSYSETGGNINDEPISFDAPIGNSNIAPSEVNPIDNRFSGPPGSTNNSVISIPSTPGSNNNSQPIEAPFPTMN